MKKTFLLILIAVLSFNLYAQEDGEKDNEEIRTIFSDQVFRIGGFGGPMMNFSMFNKEFAFFMGGAGAVLINHSFYFGGGGYGMTTPIPLQISKYEELGLTDSINNYNLNFGYGGLLGGYILGWSKPVHFNFSLMAGWGGVTVDRELSYEISAKTDPVFVFLPSIEAELNVTRFFRIGLGGSFRYVASVDLEGFNDMDFSGPGVMLTFKFGSF